MWFRSDLRVSDNTTLHRACRAAREGVIAVFAAYPAQWSDDGGGSMRVDFILRKLQAPSRGLSEHDSPPLLVESSSFAAFPPKIPPIARRYQCGALNFTEEHEVNERLHVLEQSPSADGCRSPELAGRRGCRRCPVLV